MHQKHPPAKIAVFVGAEVEFCAALSLTVVAISTAQPTARRKIRLMLCVRHRPNRGVVNNRDFFYLPSTSAPVIPGSSLSDEAINMTSSAGIPFLVVAPPVTKRRCDSPQRACG